MIYFVGDQDKGYFVPEIAEKFGEKCEFSGFVSNLEELSKTILRAAYSTVILDIPTLTCVVMDYKSIGKFCKNISIANSNIRLIVMAKGYNIHSQIIQAAISGGIRYFMLGTSPTRLKEELTDALEDRTNIEAVFAQIPTEEQRDKKKDEIEKKFGSSKTIAVVGSQHRIGTTTQALQIVKYLMLEGYKACYIQLNDSSYVQHVGNVYNESSIHEEMGLVTYQNLEMYYKQEKIADILAKNYDFYIYDFGTINDKSFTLVQYLEKDIRITVSGSKADELPYIQSLLEYVDNANTEYIFSFTSEAYQSDIREMMEDKKNHTFFSDYIPDPFSYDPSTKVIYDNIIKPEKIKQKTEKRRKKRNSAFLENSKRGRNDIWLINTKRDLSGNTNK